MLSLTFKPLVCVRISIWNQSSCSRYKYEYTFKTFDDDDGDDDDDDDDDDAVSIFPHGSFCFKTRS